MVNSCMCQKTFISNHVILRRNALGTTLRKLNKKCFTDYDSQTGP